ncbi:DNA ligase D [Variovorax sp. RHLX14]|uniref:DNA ligase D n=1 Tax=Variovorax sp. RHLX14 TaxID=1259731 RepID=UPI003F47801B
MTAHEALAAYRRKRDFTKTPEPHDPHDPHPAGNKDAKSSEGLSFVVQKHHASHLHYDFRLELDGTLKSWAVPKGPCLDPAVKRMAVEVEDHPVSYGSFEGTIPPKQYGAGTVIVWDRGEWRPDGDIAATRKALVEGKLKFELRGEKLQGHWTLVRMRGKGEKQAPWLLIKEHDGEARGIDDYDVLEALPDSVLGRPNGARKPKPKAKPEAKPESKAGKKTLSSLPETLSPQLATLAAEPPDEATDWLWELKFDGYRLLTRIDDGKVRCYTRNGHDWTAKLPELEIALSRLGVRSAWLDGEIVVHDERSAPDFQALQNAFDHRSTGAIVYWVFDLLFLNGEDLREFPVEERRARLAPFLGDDEAPRLRFSEAFDAPPRDLLTSVASLGFEGLIGKRKGSAYSARRSPDWIKLKTQQRQEFVIGGFTAPKGSRAGFGALLLGVYPDGRKSGELVYCGNVGTGFDGAMLADVKTRLDKLSTDRSPFGASGVPTGVKAQWVRPQLIAEVAFAGWTREGRIRHGVFRGLRSDKPAKQIVRERPASEPTVRPSRSSKPAMHRSNAVKVSNPDRVIDPESGATKGDLFAYYQQVAETILPHLKGRPVSLVRAPDGVSGELFFQKHAKGNDMPGVRLLDPSLDPDHEPLLEIDSAQGLASAAQMNVIELHTWNATASAIDRPDRMTFDLDPGEGVDWAHVQEAALLVRTLLQEVGLTGFLKTSGGKGLHVVVPIRRHYDWEAVKSFSQALVMHLATTIPERFVAKSGPRNRVGKVFVDYLRNGFGATTASAWSVRSRPGLGVSVPVTWDELPELGSGAHWRMGTALDRLSVGNAPWADWEMGRQGLARPMKKIGFTNS